MIVEEVMNRHGDEAGMATLEGIGRGVLGRLDILGKWVVNTENPTGKIKDGVKNIKDTLDMIDKMMVDD